MNRNHRNTAWYSRGLRFGACRALKTVFDPISCQEKSQQNCWQQFRWGIAREGYEFPRRVPGSGFRSATTGQVRAPKGQVLGTCKKKKLLSSGCTVWLLPASRPGGHQAVAGLFLGEGPAHTKPGRVGESIWIRHSGMFPAGMFHPSHVTTRFQVILFVPRPRGAIGRAP